MKIQNVNRVTWFVSFLKLQDKLLLLCFFSCSWFWFWCFHFDARLFHFLKKKQENNGKITTLLLLISSKIIFHNNNFSCSPLKLKLNKYLQCFSQRMLSVLILKNWMGKNCKENFHSVLALSLIVMYKFWII